MTDLLIPKKTERANFQFKKIRQKPPVMCTASHLGGLTYLH